MQKLIYEFLPIALFFIVYKVTDDIYNATLVLIVSSLLQVLYEYLRYKKVEKSRLIGAILILVLGGATVLLHDDIFIKWKVTVINWLFALVLFGSYFIGKKTIIERMMGSMLELPKEIWHKLNAMWILFFFISGLLNIYFAFYYGLDLPMAERTDMWVNFKFYGLMGLTLVFMVGQVVFLQKYLPEPEEAVESESKKLTIDNESAIKKD